MRANIVNNVSSVTGIPQSTMNSLFNKVGMCIAHNCTTAFKIDDSVSADIGIGTLCIGKCEDGIRYKFIPNKELEEAICDASDGIDSMEIEVENTLANRIMSTYKELF